MDRHLKIKVKYLGAFTDAAKSKEEICKIDVPSLGALIDHLLARNGEKFDLLLMDPATESLRGGITILVNGHRRELEYKLSDGDEVTLLTPIAGGKGPARGISF
jgi:molybdopterin converting factor small subunit